MAVFDTSRPRTAALADDGCGRDVNAALVAGGVIAEPVAVERPRLENRFGLRPSGAAVGSVPQLADLALLVQRARESGLRAELHDARRPSWPPRCVSVYPRRG